MKKGTFKLRFLDFQVKNIVNIKDYSDYFENYTSSKWDADPSFGLFQYYLDQKRYSLTFIHHTDYGIALNFNLFSLEIHRLLDSWVSIGDKHRLNHYYINDYDDDVCIGTFLTPLQAWEIIKAFLERPTEMPWDFDTIDSWERLQSPKHYV